MKILREKENKREWESKSYHFTVSCRMAFIQSSVCLQCLLSCHNARWVFERKLRTVSVCGQRYFRFLCCVSFGYVQQRFLFNFGVFQLLVVKSFRQMRDTWKFFNISPVCELWALEREKKSFHLFLTCFMGKQAAKSRKLINCRNERFSRFSEDSELVMIDEWHFLAPQPPFTPANRRQFCAHGVGKHPKDLRKSRNFHFNLSSLSWLLPPLLLRILVYYEEVLCRMWRVINTRIIV